jgi:hypothetical protein
VTIQAGKARFVLLRENTQATGCNSVRQRRFYAVEIPARTMNKRSFLAIGAAAVVVLIAGIWFGARQPHLPEAPSLTPSENSSSAEKNATAKTASQPSPDPQKSVAQKPEPPAEIPKWEMQIDQALRSNVNEEQTAQILIAMLPTLPEDGQIEAGHHISNLLPDSDYNRVMPILLNPSMSEPVLSVFMTDLMNRSDSTKLHALLDVAKVPNHPFHDEAMSTLQIFLGDDYGTDWGKWQSAMDKYLSSLAQPAN